jgi:hypothetical protein
MPGIRAKQRQRKDALKGDYTKKQERRRREREEYVLRVSVTGNVLCPFWNEDHCQAALRYIDTGIEALKEQFPSESRF